MVHGFLPEFLGGLERRSRRPFASKSEFALLAFGCGDIESRSRSRRAATAFGREGSAIPQRNRLVVAMLGLRLGGDDSPLSHPQTFESATPGLAGDPRFRGRAGEPRLRRRSVPAASPE